MKTFILRLSATAACSLIASTAIAADASKDDVKALLQAVKEQSARLNAQEDALKSQEEALERQKQALAKEKERFNKLKAQVATVTGKPVEAEERKVSAATAAAASPSAGGKPEEVGTERKAQKQEKPPEIAALTDVGGVLLRKGQMVFTPGIEYARSSATRVDINGFSIAQAINIGTFEITKVDRDTLTGSAGLRYGLTNRLELEAKVPYVYRSDTTKSRPIAAPGTVETLTDVKGHDIGDVEFGAHYQINNGTQGWPFFVGNLRLKTITGTSPFEVPLDGNGLQTELPTGTGFYALQPSVTAIYPVDPVVYYANIGYLYNMEKDVGGSFGTIDPGDSVSASFGMGLSLNDKGSISFGYSHNTVFETKQNGAAIAGGNVLQVGSLDLGYSYNLTNDTNLNFTVSTGVTEDAPDVRLIFRVPMTFNLR